MHTWTRKQKYHLKKRSKLLLRRTKWNILEYLWEQSQKMQIRTRAACLVWKTCMVEAPVSRQRTLSAEHLSREPLARALTHREAGRGNANKCRGLHSKPIKSICTMQPAPVCALNTVLDLLDMQKKGSSNDQNGHKPKKRYLTNRFERDVNRSYKTFRWIWKIKIYNWMVIMD
jgi:hypothetical protein